jgi:hypothetical protein
MSQNVMAGSLFVGSATSLVIDVSDENNADTATPASRSESVPRARDALTAYAITTAATPHANAASCVWTGPSEKRMAIDAPKPAPDDAPRRSGETMGLRNSP